MPGSGEGRVVLNQGENYLEYFQAGDTMPRAVIGPSGFSVGDGSSDPDPVGSGGGSVSSALTEVTAEDTYEIDLSAVVGSLLITMTENLTVTVTNPPSDDETVTLDVHFLQGGAGDWTLTFDEDPDAISWQSGIPGYVYGDTGLITTYVFKGMAGEVLGFGPGGEVWDEASVDTSETTTSTTYADLATSGPAATVVVPASGSVRVTVSSRISNTNASTGNFIGVDISGANTVAATDDKAMSFTPAGANGGGQFSLVRTYTGLTPGATTFKMVYRCSANTATFRYRQILVQALP